MDKVGSRKKEVRETGGFDPPDPPPSENVTRRIFTSSGDTFLGSSDQEQFLDNCRSSRTLIGYRSLSIGGQTHEFIVHTMSQ